MDNRNTKGQNMDMKEQIANCDGCGKKWFMLSLSHIMLILIMLIILPPPEKVCYSCLKDKGWFTFGSLAGCFPFAFVSIAWLLKLLTLSLALRLFRALEFVVCGWQSRVVLHLHLFGFGVGSGSLNVCFCVGFRIFRISFKFLDTCFAFALAL